MARILADSACKVQHKTGTIFRAAGLTATIANAYVTAMSLKPLVLLPDPILKTVSKPVERVDKAC